MLLFESTQKCECPCYVSHSNPETAGAIVFNAAGQVINYLGTGTMIASSLTIASSPITRSTIVPLY